MTLTNGNFHHNPVVLDILVPPSTKLWGSLLKSLSFYDLNTYNFKFRSGDHLRSGKLVVTWRQQLINFVSMNLHTIVWDRIKSNCHQKSFNAGLWTGSSSDYVMSLYCHHNHQSMSRILFANVSFAAKVQYKSDCTHTPSSDQLHFYCLWCMIRRRRRRVWRPV